MEQIRIRMFEQDYGDWSAHFRSSNNGSLIYKNLEVVLDDSYTHAIIYNLTKVLGLKPLPKKNVIGFLTEPFETYNPNNNIDYIREHIGTYFCHDANKLGLDKSIFKNGEPFLGPCCGTDQMHPYGVKTKTMSMIASAKGYFPGHALRHQIIRKILNSPLGIDIYGRGLEGLYSDPRVKGTLHGDKEPAFRDYKFTIAIENCSEVAWITEKFYDPILRGVIPLYWGASAINQFYSSNCHVELSNTWNVDQIFDKITRIYNDNQQYGAHNIEEGQRIIKERQNLQEFLWRHFNGIT
jgi:hypothetical protein